VVILRGTQIIIGISCQLQGYASPRARSDHWGRALKEKKARRRTPGGTGGSQASNGTLRGERKDFPITSRPLATEVFGVSYGGGEKKTAGCSETRPTQLWQAGVGVGKGSGS